MDQADDALGDEAERHQCATAPWKLYCYYHHDRAGKIVPPKTGGDDKSDLFILTWIFIH